MKLLKEQFYDILRLFINQIGIAIFSFMLYTAAGMVLEDTSSRMSINLVISIFSVLFYFVLIYTVTWEYGAKDRIRVDGGRLIADGFKGAKMGALANIPAMAAALLALLIGALMIVLPYDAVGVIRLIFDMIARFLSLSYLGSVSFILQSLSDNQTLYSYLQEALFVVMPILAIAVTQFGYTMGFKERKLFSSGNKNKK